MKRSARHIAAAIPGQSGKISTCEQDRPISLPMMLLDAIAESRIAAAISAGEFDGLGGTGLPLILDDDSAIPEALRVAYRILKNSGFLPPEQQLRKEISQLESLLLQVECDAEADRLRRRLLLLKTRLALQGRDVNLLAEEGAYRHKLLQRMTRRGSCR